jgi:fatty acid desaturase
MRRWQLPIERPAQRFPSLWRPGYHMFPVVPYHALPRLHEVIRHDLPPPNPSIWAACREMFGAVMRQRREPATARPYKGELHQAVPEQELA